jgi:CheY-like chemotaxis protein
MASKQLLLIDDNEDNQVLVKFALETHTDWNIIIASNGIEGITKAELKRPDVILLDYIMPDLDGITVCEILKSNLFTCSIPIIFMTAMVHSEILNRLKNTMVEGIITKPFDPINLHSQIVKFCQWEFALHKYSLRENHEAA